jgi:ElaB/YqjD/DUF883 family membrane-anchored ribosome-binding protein
MWNRAGERRGDRAINAAQDVAARSAKYMHELTTQGRQLVQDIDTQLGNYTGKSGDAWIAQASRLIARHPWRAVGIAAIAAYVLGKLRA